MQSEERIQRMHADGILTAAQADMLLDSLAWGGDAGAARAERPTRRSITRWALGLIAIALIAAFLIFTNGTGVEPPAPQDVAATLNDPGGIGQMNKGVSGVLAIAILLIVPLLLWMWLHNSIVTKEETVFEAWAQTESNLERRADLIPALVDTVSRYLRHESETLTSITAERGGGSLADALDALLAAQQATADLIGSEGENIVESEEDLAVLYAAQAQVGRSMTSFLAVAENYPELRSSDQFLELQAQLEGTENRINVARMRFNESVASYNAAIRRLPASLVASAGGFERKAYFEADEASGEAPELAFD